MLKTGCNMAPYSLEFIFTLIITLHNIPYYYNRIGITEEEFGGNL